LCSISTYSKVGKNCIGNTWNTCFSRRRKTRKENIRVKLKDIGKNAQTHARSKILPFKTELQNTAFEQANNEI
jgi:hypothetical protein